MKRFIFTVIALFLFTGVANAASIASAVNPVDGPELWVTAVYNNDDATMDVGDCAQWDIENSTGDNDNYVEQCDAVDTFLVAGVVWPVDIASKDKGLIVTKGVVQVDTLGAIMEGSAICASATAGSVYVCSDPEDDSNQFGYAVTGQSGGSATAMVFRIN